MTPQERRDLRLKRLNKTGWDINQKLTQLLAGKNITLGEIGLSGIDMIDDKEVRLRQFLGLVNDARPIIQAENYPSKVAGEETKRQLYLDDNPWMEAAKPEVAGSDDGYA